jgi:toxin ParE1/3/4
MAAEIRWTKEAAFWLEDIHRYIAKDNPEAAGRVIEKIYEKVQILTEFPEIGYHYRREPEGDIRVILYGHYRIAYFFRDPDGVEILGVFHGALDIKHYI